MMGMAIVANPSKWSNMHVIDLNQYFSEIVYLTDEDLLDIEERPNDLDLFFGPHLLFHFADGGAILQHRRPETTAFIAASDARAEAQSAWEAAKESLSETVATHIVAHYADDSHHPDSNDGRMAHITLDSDKLTGTLTGDNALGQPHRFTMGGQWHALPVTECYSC